MSYRDDLAALDARVNSGRGELAATEQLAVEARRLVRQHVLEAELATPCAALWDEMQGDERVRHCDHCNKNVYNFSELTRDQIDAVVLRTEGKLCGRFFLRADGSILTKDCKRDVRLRPSRLKVGLGVGALAAAALVSGAAVASQMAPNGPTSLSAIWEEESSNVELIGAVQETPVPEQEDRAVYQGEVGFPRDYQGGVSISSEPRDH